MHNLQRDIKRVCLNAAGVPKGAKTVLTSLQTMSDLATVYQHKIKKYKVGQKEQQAKHLLFSMYNEIGEIADLIQWKDWKKQRDITNEDLKHITFEVIDVIFFIIEFCDVLGINMEDLAERFYIKLLTNITRHTIEKE